MQKAGLSGDSNHPRDTSETSSLGPRDHERLLTRPIGAVVTREGRAVRVSAPVEDFVNRVPEREHDRPPVVQRVVEGEDRGFLPAVLGLRGRERRGDLVDQPSPLQSSPVRSRNSFSCAATLPKRVGVPKAMPSAQSMSSSRASG